MLSGYKTIIIAVLLGIFTTLKSLGYIDHDTWETIFGILSSGGLLTMRAAVAKGK